MDNEYYSADSQDYAYDLCIRMLMQAYKAEFISGYEAFLEAIAIKERFGK